MWIRFELKAPSVYLLTHVQHAVQNDLLHFVLAVLCNMIFASLRCSRGFFGWGIIGTVRRSVWSLNNATPLRFPASLFGHLALMGPYSSLFTMYLSLSIQPLSLSAFYSKANLAQAARFFSRVLFPIELKWLNRIPLPALFGQFLTFIPQIRHKSTAQKDRGSHNTKVLQTFECCKPSREFYFDGLFQQR